MSLRVEEYVMAAKAESDATESVYPMRHSFTRHEGNEKLGAGVSYKRIGGDSCFDFTSQVVNKKWHAGSAGTHI